MMVDERLSVFREDGSVAEVVGAVAKAVFCESTLSSPGEVFAFAVGSDARIGCVERGEVAVPS